MNKIKGAMQILFRTLSVFMLLLAVYCLLHPTPNKRPWQTLVLVGVLSFSSAMKWQIAEALK